MTDADEIVYYESILTKGFVFKPCFAGSLMRCVRRRRIARSVYHVAPVWLAMILQSV